MRIRQGLWLSLALFAGCAKAPAEERLRARIGAMQDAVVARDVSVFMEGVAQDFIGSGNLDRAALQQLVRLQVMRNAAIGATLGPIEVQLQGERATVEFDAVLTGGAGGLLPERAQGYRIKSGWRDGGHDWQVFSAEWTPLL
jgi:hypothetical protein